MDNITFKKKYLKYKYKYIKLKKQSGGMFRFPKPYAISANSTKDPVDNDDDLCRKAKLFDKIILEEVVSIRKKLEKNQNEKIKIQDDFEKKYDQKLKESGLLKPIFDFKYGKEMIKTNSDLMDKLNKEHKIYREELKKGLNDLEGLGGFLSTCGKTD
jgi:hypothetical protein